MRWIKDYWALLVMALGLISIAALGSYLVLVSPP